MSKMETNKEKIVLIGSGGYCSGIIDSIERGNLFSIYGITDPAVRGTFCGYPVLGDDSVLQSVFDSGIKKAFVTIGSVGVPALRKKMVRMAKEIGFELVSVIDPSASVATRANLGEMIYVGKQAVINSFVDIGDFCIINTGSIVEHGSNISDWVHIAPGAVVAGDVVVGDSSHIGLNATVLQGVTIGHDVVVGAGSTVIRNVSDNKTVYGVVKG